MAVIVPDVNLVLGGLVSVEPKPLRRTPAEWRGVAPVQISDVSGRSVAANQNSVFDFP